MNPGIDALRARFIIEISKAAKNSRRLEEAFQGIDRADFVPSYLVPDPSSPAGRPIHWKRLSREDGIPWADHLYSPHAALVTKLDREGVPVSSSTDPSLMAAMINALQPPLGGRILEIGLGTGYNAAILSRLVGIGGSVHSVDIDEEICSAADLRLRCYPNISVVRGDGRKEIGAPASYDGILVTANAVRTELAWFSQLKPGGRLVVNLRGPMASGLFAGTATATGVVKGRYIDYEEVGFTPLHGQPGAPDAGFDRDLIESPSRILSDTFTAQTAEALIYNRDARAFIQLMVEPQKFDYYSITTGTEQRPGALIRTEWERCWICLGRMRGGTRQISWSGDASLFRALREAYRAWLAAGAPSIDRLELEIGATGTRVRAAGQMICMSLLFRPEQSQPDKSLR